MHQPRYHDLPYPSGLKVSRRDYRQRTHCGFEGHLVLYALVNAGQGIHRSLRESTSLHHIPNPMSGRTRFHCSTKNRLGDLHATFKLSAKADGSQNDVFSKLWQVSEDACLTSCEGNKLQQHTGQMRNKVWFPKQHHQKNCHYPFELERV